MPLFDYHCSVCGTTEEYLVKRYDDAVLCECGRQKDKKVSLPSIVLFHKGWYEHIAADPIYVDSMKQLKKECKKHGCTSTYALDTC